MLGGRWYQSGHDQRRVERASYVVAGDGALRMADQSSDSDLGKAEIVCNAGKAVPQDVWCDVG